MKTAKDANAGLTQLFYDGRGNLIRRVNAKGGEEIFGYDLADRPTSKTDPLGRQTTMTYNAVGRLAQITDASGRSTSYSYDAAGQVVTQTYGDGSFETFGYDGAGRRTSMVDATGTASFEWDLIGRPTKVTYPSGKILTSAFDDAGNRTTLTYPDGTAAAFGYDGNNRLSTLSHPTVGSIAYGYDLDGRLTAETIPGGTSRSYNFTDGRMASYSETIGGATRTTSFAYDSADRIISETTAGATTAYDYDNAGQLTEVVRGSDVTSYGYDQVGNRASKTQGSVSTAYSYDGAQQLTSAVRAVSGVPTQQAAFTHDGEGRLTLAESLGSSFAIGYDARGFPTQITHVDVVTGTFATQRRYDAEGRLTSAELTSPVGAVSQSSFAWDHVSQIPEIATTSSGGADTNFLYGLGREVAIRSGGFDAFSYDRYGSALSTEDTNDLVRAPGYDEFGVPNSSGATPTLLQEVIGTVGDLSTNHTPLFGYRGEMHLNGLVHLRAREYATGLGRFTTKDPLDGVPGQVMFANPYPYAANNPLTHVDPLGQSPVSDSELTQTGKCGSRRASMIEYLTVLACAPDGFVERHYKPRQMKTDGGLRMVDPFGHCGLDEFYLDKTPWFDFTKPCKVHDYGYDLLRYFGKEEKPPLSKQARKDADDLFANDLVAHCQTRFFLVQPSCYEAAYTYWFFVDTNSVRENYRVPSGSIRSG